MFAIIKKNQITWFTNEKLKKEENMLFDELIEWDFDINKDYEFKNWEVLEVGIIEKLKVIEKEQIISEYQAKMLEIQNTQSELNIAIEGMEDEDEYIAQMSTARKWILETRIHTLKQELKAIAQEWVAKFGNEIINEL